MKYFMDGFFSTLPLLMVAGILEALTVSGLIPTYILPRPTEVFFSLIDNRNELVGGLKETLMCSLMGLCLSLLGGGFLGIAISGSKILRQIFLPYTIFLQTVPIIAIAPILVIWFGFGVPTVVATATIVSIFPVIANTILGLNSVDRGLLELYKFYGASRFDIYFRLRFPSGLAHFFAGIKIAAGLAVVGAIVGEFIAGGGLGSIIDSGRTQQRLDLVFSAVLLASLIGWLVCKFVEKIEFLVLGKWHPAFLQESV